MNDEKLSLIHLLANNYLKNPFFSIPLSKQPIHPLLHQTEVVARALCMNPTRILLADVIGLGKTVEALRILYALKQVEKLGRILVVVPTMLEKQWDEELRRFGFSPRWLNYYTLRELAEGVDGEGVFIGRMDTLKKDEYFQLLERVKWDAIVVDEAHRIEAMKTYRARFIELARKQRDATVILLSATPHRGKEKLYLYVLSALDPEIVNYIPRGRGRGTTLIVDAEFYMSTHNSLVFRRTKDDVNNIYEMRAVFKPAKVIDVLLKPSREEAELIDEFVMLGKSIVSTFRSMLYESGSEELARLKGLIGLLSMLLIKRGVSSPRAIADTFTTLATRRIEALSEIPLDEIKSLRKAIRAALDPDEYAEELEVEPDDAVNRLTELLVSTGLMQSQHISKIAKCYKTAEKFISGELHDTKIDFLVKLVDLASGEPTGELADMKDAKIIVFTEFRDTAKYIRDRLLNVLKAKYGNADDMVRVLTSENKNEYKEVVEWLEKPGVKVLVATDVMSEGLNLQQANVIVNYEVVYSPARLEQRVGRVWRYGQRRTVYVFNVFYLHPLERRIHDIFFRKVYAITESLGKQEMALGDEVYLVTVHNTLFDETLKQSLGDEKGREIARSIGAIPLRRLLEHGKKPGRGRPLKLTWDEKVLAPALVKSDEEYEQYLAKLADEFVREMIRVAETISRTRVYPTQSSREDIEDLLEQAWGIRNTHEANELATLLYETYYSIAQDPHAPKNPLEKLHSLVAKTSCYTSRKPLFFALGSSSRQLYLLYKVSIEIGRRELSDMVLVEVDIDTREPVVRRGLKLVETIRRILPVAMPVDEVYGWLGNFIQSIDEKASLKAKSSVKADKIISRIQAYESSRKRLHEKLGLEYREFFATRIAKTKSELIAVFFTVGLLPSSRYLPETGVWEEFEKRYIDEIVLKFERQAGRKPEPVHLKEHYDIYSKGASEERYIECKGHSSPVLAINLTDAEYNTAKELGDKYWLYLVYGIGTDKSTVLAIRNPVNRLPLKQEKYPVWVVRYTFSPGT